ncbi:transposase [candidate division WOR-3 bacterium]|nr:transposase [candidate division WOR-3 bacterium]
MHYPKVRNIHRPVHLYLDSTLYFVSASTLNQKLFFNTDAKKQFIKDALGSTTKKYGYTLYGWTILDNHFHILFKTSTGKWLSKFIANIKGESSYRLNRLEGTIGRRIWYQYWDVCIHNKTDFYTHLNYIHHNCIKHRCTDKMSDYRWTSYHSFVKKYGIEWVNSCLKEYPIVDFTPKGGYD